MQTIDVVIILLVLWAAYNGWKRGLIKEIISMIGFFVGLFVAYELYTTFGNYLAPSLSSNATAGRYLGYFVAFVGLWIVVPILLGVLANLVTRSLKLIHLGLINSLGGALVSTAKYVILMSFVFSAMNFLGIMSREKKDASLLYKPVASLAETVFNGKEKPQSATSEEEKSDTLWVKINHPKSKSR